MSYMREKMKSKKNVKNMKKLKAGGKDKFKSKKKSGGNFQKMDTLGDTVLWLSRVLMFAFSYLYHSDASMVNITWIVLSFIFPDTMVFLFSGFVMLPILLIQFVLVYGIRLPIVKDRPFFQNYGQMYAWDMASQTIEQSLLFLTLICFFMMPACYVLSS